MSKLKLLPVLFLLLLSACLLSGCGTGEAPATVEAPAAEQTQAAEELVYAASFREIPIDRDKSLEPLAYTDSGFYALSWEEQVNPDPAEGEPSVDYVQKLYYVNQNGQVTAFDYGGSSAPADSEGRKDYYAGSNLQNIFPLENGELIAVEMIYASWFEGPEDMSQSDPSYWDYYKNENSYSVLRLSAEGELLSSSLLEWDANDMENGWLDFRSAVMDGEGRLIAVGQQSVFAFGQDGSLIGSVELEDWGSSPTLLADGRVGVVCSGPRGSELLVLDLEKLRTGQRLSLEEWPQNTYPGGGAYDFYFTSGTQLYGCRLSDGSCEEALNLLDCDLSADSLRFLQAEEDGSFRGCCADETGLSLVELTEVPRSTLPEKRELTLGVLGEDDGLLNQVQLFNRRHKDLRIRVVDYSDSFENSGGDIDALSKLSTEIMAGDMPDLLAMDALPYEQMAAKGLLEDLYPWLDQDEELRREDFLPTVLAAAETHGGLYRIASGFQIDTLIGASSVVGEEPGLRYEKLEQALSTMPEGCTILGPTVSRDEMLMRCLLVDMDSFVDWENSSCDFESQDFRDLLAFCAGFPAEPDNRSGGSDYGRAASGQQLLLELNVSSLDELGYADQYFGGKVTYVGYPSRTGSGSLMMLSNSLSMTASCSDKAAAWEFLRSFLLPDYQRRQYTLPLRQDVFHEQLEDAMRIDYETDENGKPVLDENGEKIPISRGGMGMATEDGEMLSFEFYGLTQDQADRFLAMLEQAQAFPGYNGTIYEMVQKEAEAYFAGERSVEDTARLIQSKVSLYLSEQS